jgi:hypothetical protein
MRLGIVMMNANTGFSNHAQPREPMEFHAGLLVFSAKRRKIEEKECGSTGIGSLISKGDGA